MFGRKIQRFRLRCDKEHLTQVVDTFGESLRLLPNTETAETVDVEVEASEDAMERWILSQGNYLQVVNPDKDFLERLRQGDTVYIHPEAEYHPSTTLQKIINAGMIPGIAINPGTSIETVMEMLRIVKKVLVMSVNPGNAGQMYLPYVGKKYTKLLSMKEEMHFEIYWDGACSADKIREYAPKGVRGFVLGTTLLFGKAAPYKETLANIRELKF